MKQILSFVIFVLVVFLLLYTGNITEFAALVFGAVLGSIMTYSRVKHSRDEEAEEYITELSPQDYISLYDIGHHQG